MTSPTQRKPSSAEFTCDSTHQVLENSAGRTTSVRNHSRLIRPLITATAAFLFCCALTLQAQSPTSDWPRSYPGNDPSQSQNSGPNQYPDNQSNNGQYPPDQRLNGQAPYAGSAQSYPQQGYGQGAAQPLSPARLQQLVAPIALYPDTLVAQVLAASTYPQQVAEADRWRQAQGYAPAEQIADGADAQAWDPSVKALTAFPQVLAELAGNLPWTTDLGNAYYNQPQDVLEAVQVMRQRAQAAGNLRSTPQEVVRYDQGNIEVEPANPQFVYVPAYNPWAVYGAPVSPYPGFSLLAALGSFFGSAFGSSPVRFGLGIALSAFSHASWGWLAWGLSWLTHSVLFHQSNYYSHSATVADWGFAHGGRRAFADRGGWRGDGFNRAENGWHGGGHNDRGFRPPEPYHNRYAESRGEERFGPGFRPFGGGDVRTPERVYNRFQPPARPQQEARGSYGSRASGGSGENYRSPGVVYNRPSQSYRAPAAGFSRGESGDRSSRSFSNRELATSSAKPAHSGGFHLFGGGHHPKNYSGGKNFSGGRGNHSFGGGHAPKSFGGGKSFKSKSGGGGHSGGLSGGRHRH